MCLYCNEPFIPIRSTAKYCSDKCRIYSHRTGTKVAILATSKKDSVTNPDNEDLSNEFHPVPKPKK